MKTNSIGKKGISALQVFILIFILIVGGILFSFFGASLLSGMSLEQAAVYLVQSVTLQVGLWFAFIAGGTFLVILGITMLKISTRKFFVNISIILARVGTILICLSILIVILDVILPLVSTKQLTYEECTGFITSNVYGTFACIFSGYAPTSGATDITYANYLIVSVLAPFVFFYYIFDDLINQMNFPSNRDAQRAIAFVGAYAALRGALSTYFVQFFAYSWFGMGALAFGVFMTMMVWSLIRRYYAGVIEGEHMSKLFRIMTGKEPADPRDVFRALAGIGMPYANLSSHLDTWSNWFRAAGYPSIGVELERIIHEGEGKGKERDNYVRQELERLANS